MDKTLRLQVIFGAVDKLLRPLKAIRAETKLTSAGLKQALERVKALNAQKARIDGFRKAKLEAGELATKLKAARDRATAAGQALAQADTPTRKLTSDFAKAKKELGGFEDKQRSAQRTLNTLRDAMGRAGIDTLRLAREEERVKRDLSGATAQMERQKRVLGELAERQRKLTAAKAKSAKIKEAGEKMAGGGLKLAAAGAGLAAPFVIAARAAVSFEAEMGNVYKVVDWKKKFGRQFEKELIGQGVKLGIDADGMASIAGQGAMGGVRDRSELLKFTADAAMLKEALNFGSAEEAGSMLSGWRHAFNLNEAAAHSLGDTVTGLTRKWGALHGKGSEVGEIITNVGVLAKVAGSGTRETAALASVLSSMNVESGVASTSIKNLMLNLTRGDAATGKQKKAFKAIGVDAKALALAMSKDAGPAIVDVLEKVKRLPKEAQAGALSQIFGSRSIGAIGAFLERLDRVKEAMAFVGDTKNTDGQMQQEFAGKTDNTAFRLHQAQANAKALAITIGADLLPMIDGLAQRASALLTKLNDWAARHPALTKAITFTSLALAGILILVGGVALAAAGLLGPLALMNVAFAAGSPVMLAFAGTGALVQGAFVSMAAGALEFGAALLLNPITWIVAGIALLAALAFIVIRNWKPLTAFFGRLWDGVKLKFGEFMGWMGGLKDRFFAFGAHMMQGLADGVTAALGNVKKAVVGAGAAVVDWFKGKLGIHSPSRVFAVLGDHTMSGLALGLDRSRTHPLRAIATTAAALAALGGGTSPAAALPSLRFADRTSVSARPGAAGAARAGAHYEVHIHPAPGMDEAALARLVARELDKRERQQAVTRRSQFADYGA